MSSKEYRCDKCGAAGVKLWREYQVMYTDLFCAECALKNQGKAGTIDANGRRDTVDGKTDQVGGLVPAVPTPEGDGWYGYSAVPTEGVSWWRSLPTYAEGRADR